MKFVEYARIDGCLPKQGTATAASSPIQLVGQLLEEGGSWIGFDLKSHLLSQDGRLVGVRRGVNQRNMNIAHEQMHIWPMKIENVKTS